MPKSRNNLAIWNICTLTRRMMELLDMIALRSINIICLQETKWAGEIPRVLGRLKIQYKAFVHR